MRVESHVGKSACLSANVTQEVWMWWCVARLFSFPSRSRFHKAVFEGHRVDFMVNSTRGFQFHCWFTSHRDGSPWLLMLNTSPASEPVVSEIRDQLGSKHCLWPISGWLDNVAQMRIIIHNPDYRQHRSNRHKKRQLAMNRCGYVNSRIYDITVSSTARWIWL